ncbi:MAG TPA: PKD domain-containing protein, partial [Thermoplasmata archaeon]|nr:PKD domain-containing protein [Thermoplasmata archaeon]
PDVMSGPNQDIPGSDGFGDVPYAIDFDSEDRYPLMVPTCATPMNSVPTAVLSLDASAVSVGEAITASGNASTDSDGTVVAYNFTWGDGGSTGWLAASFTTHAYSAGGTYIVTLLVRDDDGSVSGAVTASVTVTSLPNLGPVAVISVTPGTTGFIGTLFTFNATASSDSDGTVVSYVWDFGNFSLGTGPVVNHTFAVTGTHVVTLTVTDDDNATDLATVTITIANRAPLINGSTPATPVTLGALDADDGLAFDVQASDPDGDPLTYLWRLDGVPVGGDSRSYLFQRGIGPYRLNVTVSDGNLVAWREWEITVQGPPSPPPGEATPLAVAGIFFAVMAASVLLLLLWHRRRGREPVAAEPAMAEPPAEPSGQVEAPGMRRETPEEKSQPVESGTLDTKP